MSKRFRPSRPANRLLRPRSLRTSITGEAPVSNPPPNPQEANSPEAALENLEWKDEPSSGGEILTAASDEAASPEAVSEPAPVSEAVVSAPAGTPREPSASSTQPFFPVPEVLLAPEVSPAPEVDVTSVQLEAAQPPSAIATAQELLAEQTQVALAVEALAVEALAVEALAVEALAVEALAVEEVAPPSIPERVTVPEAARSAGIIGDGREGKKKKKKKGNNDSSAAALGSTAALSDSSASALGSTAALSDSSARHRAVSLEDDPMAEEFFSVLPPAVTEADHDDDLNPPPPPLSPEVIERQRRARKIVGGVVAVASLVVLFGIGRALFSGKPADAHVSQTPPAVAQEAAPPKVEETAVAAAPEPPKVEPVAAATAEPVASEIAVASADASASASATASATVSAEAEVKPSGSLSPDELKALKKKAETSINRGDNKAAIEAALEALKGDQADALTYLYLGSAYMSTGKMKEAKQAFDDCAKNAKGSPHYGECIQMGGKK